MKHIFYKVKSSRYLLIAAAVSLCALAMFSSRVLAAAAQPGCYIQNSNGNYTVQDNSACSSGTSDPTKNCYVETADANGNVSPYGQVTCASIDSSKVYGFTLSKTSGGGHVCGSGENAVHVSIDLGCKGKGNPVVDLLFAIIRLLSAGVGILVVASIVVGGIQFSTSRSDPQAAASAINRIKASLIALIIYIFAFAILNYVIPGEFLK